MSSLFPLFPYAYEEDTPTVLGHTVGNRIENPVYDPIPKGFKIAGDPLKKTALESPAADIVVQVLEIGGLDYLDTKLARYDKRESRAARARC